MDIEGLKRSSEAIREIVDGIARFAGIKGKISPGNRAVEAFIKAHYDGLYSDAAESRTLKELLVGGLRAAIDQHIRVLHINLKTAQDQLAKTIDPAAPSPEDPGFDIDPIGTRNNASLQQMDAAKASLQNAPDNVMIRENEDGSRAKTGV